MRLRVFSALTFIWMFALVALASAQKHCSKVNIDPTTGFCTVPDPALTHGFMDASQAYVSNQDRPRKVTKAEEVEQLLWRKVCRDKTMTLAQAKRIYLQGGTKFLPQH